MIPLRTDAHPAEPKSAPIPYVTASASAPPTPTRTAARVRGAPPSPAPTTPNTQSATRVTAAMTALRGPAGASAATSNGMMAPAAKLAADAPAACGGRAAPASVWPSSSRRCAPRGSASWSAAATSDASSGGSPRRSQMEVSSAAGRGEGRRGHRQGEGRPPQVGGFAVCPAVPADWSRGLVNRGPAKTPQWVGECAPGV